MDNRLNFYGQTDVGNVRLKNEDSLWPVGSSGDRTPTEHPYADNPWGLLFIVADGMGGHGAGDVASKIVVDTVPGIYYDEQLPFQSPAKRMEHAIKEAHRKIIEHARTDSANPGMGSTVAAVVIRDDTVYVAWVGDSRVYRLRDNRLKQLTKDHAVLQEEVAAGNISWDELHYHPKRSKLSNSLSAKRSNVEVSLKEVELQDGDQLVLCSDGLSSEIQNARIEKVVKAALPPESVRGLIQRAKTEKTWKKNGKKVRSKGGEDNVTAIVIHTPGVQLAKPLPLLAFGLAAAALLLILALLGGGFLFWRGTLNQPTDSPVMSTTTDTPAPNESDSVVLGEAAATPTLSPPPTNTSAIFDQAVTATAPAVSERALPTSTLAPYITATPALLTPTPVVTGAVGSTAVTSAPLLPGGDFLATDIQHLKPEPGTVFPKGVYFVEFQWQYGTDCVQPFGYGFDLWVWREGLTPSGAMNALEEQEKISCERGIYHFVVGDLRFAPGAAGANPGTYYWDVFLVQMDNYHPPLAVESVAASFIIAGDGPSGGGDGGGGSNSGGGGTISK